MADTLETQLARGRGGRRKAQPFVGLHVVARRDALAEAVHVADVVLRPRIALLGGAQVPVIAAGHTRRVAGILDIVALRPVEQDLRRAAA